jgi:hypothetical protein
MTIDEQSHGEALRMRHAGAASGPGHVTTKQYFKGFLLQHCTDKKKQIQRNINTG